MDRLIEYFRDNLPQVIILGVIAVIIIVLAVLLILQLVRRSKNHAEAEAAVEEGKETPVEEPKEEPAPAEEVKEEPVPVEEPKEEPVPVEEPKEEPAPSEEPKEEPAPVEEPKEEPAPVEEPKEEPAPVEEPKEEPAPARRSAPKKVVVPVKKPAKPAKKEEPTGATGKWIISQNGDRFGFRLVASNGEVMLESSTTYSSLNGAKGGIKTYQENIAAGRLEVKDTKNGFRVQVNNARGGMLAASADYKTRPTCESAAESIKRWAATAVVTVEEDDKK